MARRGPFAKGVILGVGGQYTLHTRRAIQAQFQVEGGDADFNPANTTRRMPKSRDLPGNTAHVQEYASRAEGEKATILTLLEPGHGYERVVRGLRENWPAWKICVAIVESDWGTGEAFGQGGDYLLMDVLSDIQHERKPNRLAELEAREIAG